MGTLIDDLSDASVTLARNRHRVIGALRGIRDMTQVTNQAVLAEHTDALVSTIQDLDPILSTLAGQRPLIEEMLDSVNSFLTAIVDNLVEGSPPGAGPVRRGPRASPPRPEPSAKDPPPSPHPHRAAGASATPPSPRRSTRR